MIPEFIKAWFDSERSTLWISIEPLDIPFDLFKSFGQCFPRVQQLSEVNQKAWHRTGQQKIKHVIDVAQIEHKGKNQVGQ